MLPTPRALATWRSAEVAPTGLSQENAHVSLNRHNKLASLNHLILVVCNLHQRCNRCNLQHHDAACARVSDVEKCGQHVGDDYSFLGAAQVILLKAPVNSSQQVCRCCKQRHTSILSAATVMLHCSRQLLPDLAQAMRKACFETHSTPRRFPAR